MVTLSTRGFVMPDPIYSVSKLSIPIGMLTTIIGGSAWLTSTRNEVVHVTKQFEKLEIEFRQFKRVTQVKQSLQGEMIHKIDGKMDLVLKQLGIIERRINANHKH